MEKTFFKFKNRWFNKIGLLFVEISDSSILLTYAGNTRGLNITGVTAEEKVEFDEILNSLNN